jgi:predicted MFS family arabinose efflux permease
MHGRPGETGSPDNAGPGSSVDRRLLALLCALFVVEAGLYSSITPLLPHYVRALHLSERSVGPLSGAYALGLILGSAYAAVLNGRVSVRFMVCAGLQLLAVSSAVFGFAHEILLLDAMRLTGGVGAGFIWSAGIAWIVGLAPPERRGSVLGTALGAGVAGTVLGPAIGTFAIAVGIPAAFCCVAAVALLLSAPISRRPSAPPANTSGEPAVLRALLLPGVRSASSLMCLLGLICGALNVISPLRLAHLGASNVTIGLVFLVSAAVGGVVTPSAGRMADRWGSRVPIQIGLLIAVVTLGVIPLSESVAVLGALTVVGLGVVIAGVLAPGGALLSHSIERMGISVVAASATLMLCFSVGEALGPPLAAGLAQAGSDATPMLSLAALSLMTLGLFIPRPAATQPATDR